jgi:molecular chaperone DnaJ
MQKRDYYEVLGAGRDAAPDALKKSYRRLAMKYHPDQNPDDAGAAEKFKELTEAYQVLSDPDKRARYDRFGHDAPGIGGGQGAVDVGSMADFFDSVFGSVFGGAPRARRRSGHPGRDLQYDLTITLEQAVAGAEVRVTIPRPVRCDACQGSGAAAGTKPDKCGRCTGTGTVRLESGFFAMSASCPSCGGAGEVVRNRCPQCDGRGLAVKDEQFEVSIPAGADDGAVKIIPGSGEQGRGGAPDGDLHIVIHVQEHPIFMRRGMNLLCVIKVSFPQAVLGAEVDVPTVDGPVKMRIKPGTEGGQTYRLKGKGVPALRGSGRGDELVRVDVDIPRKLTARQKELVAELGKELGSEIETRPRTFIEKLKDLLE